MKQPATEEQEEEDKDKRTKAAIREENKRLKMQLQMLQGGDAEHHLLALSEDYSELQQKYKQISPELNHYKEKVKFLSEELERFKIEVEQGQAIQRELRQSVMVLKASLREKNIELPSEERSSDDGLLQENEKLFKRIQQANAEITKLRDELLKKTNENELLQQYMDSLTNENATLKALRKEDLVLLEDKESRIEMLLDQLHEKDMTTTGTSSIAFELGMGTNDEIDVSEITQFLGIPVVFFFF